MAARETELHHHRDGDAEVEVDDAEEALEDNNAPLKFSFSCRKLLRFMGPGWLMSLAYLDPGNLESDLQQGAYTGFSIVWVLWWSTVLGLILQELSSRIGCVSGLDVAQSVRKYYPRWLNYVIYVNMEIAVIGSDIQEVVGSGIAINLITNGWIPIWVGCIITGIDTFTFLAVHYLGVRYLEALIVILISMMTVCFFVNWAETPTDPVALATGWALPIVHSYAFTQAVSTLGAVIMPHNLYLHSSLVLSRKINRASAHRVHEAIWYNFIESGLALLATFFINLAIVATNKGNFFSTFCAEQDGGPFACITNAAYDGTEHSDGEGAVCAMPRGGGYGRCSTMSLESEGVALQHGVGKVSLYIWAVGLLAAGQAATMTCTYAGQVIMGGCLQIQLAAWKRVAITRAFALVPSILVAMTNGIDHQFFDSINEWLNVLQSFQLPFAMVPVIYFSFQAGIMGRHRSGPLTRGINLFLAGVLLVVNTIAAIQFGQSFNTAGIVGLCLYGVVYFIIFLCMLMPERVGGVPCNAEQSAGAPLREQ